MRYREIKSEMQQRPIGRIVLTEGAYRFCLGLGKKMVIADNLGTVVDAIFALPAAQLDAGHAWLGIFCYALQIYFDFSGYSDMAIGLGRLLGFHFPENFDQPYRSANITEFWRRWHMTLSRWFRDYLYIPLGGNRHGRLRTFVNLWIVFFLCGLWHGAGLTFIAWGLYHGLLLILERFAHTQWNWRPSGVFGIASSFILLMIGWVLFRSPTLAAAGHYLAAMALLGPQAGGFTAALSGLTPDVMFYLALGTFFAFAPLDRLARLRFDSPAVMASQLTLVEPEPRLFVPSAGGQQFQSLHLFPLLTAALPASYTRAARPERPHGRRPQHPRSETQWQNGSSPRLPTCPTATGAS